MLDLKTQTRLLDASAAAMRSCFMAASSVWAASACRGLSAWAELAGANGRYDASWALLARTLPGRGFGAWTPLAEWNSWGRASEQMWTRWLETAAPGGQAATPQASDLQVRRTPSDFSSYRSTGGHAVAQIARPDQEAG